MSESDMSHKNFNLVKIAYEAISKEKVDDTSEDALMVQLRAYFRNNRDHIDQIIHQVYSVFDENPQLCLMKKNQTKEKHVRFLREEIVVFDRENINIKDGKVVSRPQPTDFVIEIMSMLQGEKRAAELDTQRLQVTIQLLVAMCLILALVLGSMKYSVVADALFGSGLFLAVMILCSPNHPHAQFQKYIPATIDELIQKIKASDQPQAYQDHLEKLCLFFDKEKIQYDKSEVNEVIPKK